MDPENKKKEYNSIYIIFGSIFLFIIFAIYIWFFNKSFIERHLRNLHGLYKIIS